jgi:hypothetical protein
LLSRVFFIIVKYQLIDNGNDRQENFKIPLGNSNSLSVITIILPLPIQWI